MESVKQLHRRSIIKRMKNYELKTEKFSGPIEKLLELIEERKMEIADLSLSEVVADFLNYLKEIEEAEPRLLADFVVVAARLILLKSKALLPNLKLTDEEEKDIKDLEERVRRYGEFKPAIGLFKKFYERKEFSVSRPLLFSQEPIFYPAENITIKSLEQAFGGIFKEFQKLTLESTTIESSLIKLEEKIEEIIEKIERGIGQFSELVKEKSRTEIIVLFLALLHLLKDQIIEVEQEEKFEDIMIKKI